MGCMNEPPIEELPDAECWQLLRDQDVARLAVDIAGHPDIFPINYLVDDATIVFRSGPGTKLAGAVLNRHVAFEIDGEGPGDDHMWSVVVKGDAVEVTGMEERFIADNLPLYPWVESPKTSIVRIHPTSITGRRFAVHKRR